MAMSANGFIASKTGSEEFLSDENWEKFCELAKERGNFIVGRKTYEAVKKWDEEYSFDDLVGIEKVVISQDQNFTLDEGYTLAHSPTNALAKLSQKGFEKALVTGGAQINSAFAQAGLFDEIILNVEPVFIGEGIPLFASGDFELNGELVSLDKAENGIMTLKFVISKT